MAYIAATLNPEILKKFPGPVRVWKKKSGSGRVAGTRQGLFLTGNVFNLPLFLIEFLKGGRSWWQFFAPDRTKIINWFEEKIFSKFEGSWGDIYVDSFISGSAAELL